MVLSKGTIKRIHVDRRILAHNIKNGTDDPAITVQTSKGAMKASRVKINGPSELVQAGLTAERPLSCGARIWVQTRSEVDVV